MKIVLALAATAFLAGCYGTEKAPKACADFVHQEKCVAKDHCTWSGTACVAK